MPVLEITDATFIRLQAYATPLVDSAETALTKVLDIADGANSSTSAPLLKTPTPAGAPDLTHTTLTSASINGKLLPPALCNWNALMLSVIESAAMHLPKGAEIAELIIVNQMAGQKEDNGYKFLKGLGISVQGQNSNNAWKAIAHLARATGIKVEVSFYWASHPKAAKPGESARLVA